MSDIVERLDAAIERAQRLLWRAIDGYAQGPSVEQEMHIHIRLGTYASLVAVRARLEEQHCAECSGARVRELTAEAERLMEA